MNSKPFTTKYLLPAIALLCFSAVLIAWGGQKQPRHQYQTDPQVSDTVPKNKVDRKVRDLDDVLDELDKAEFNLKMEKVNADIEKALKDIDMSKIKMEVDQAMKQVDMQKIQSEIDRAIKDIDVAQIDKQVKESLRTHQR